ncbi:hypothetical protein [Kurthia sp. Dielmo]|uniref:hypothetical protein n=1 Tax=Kurthia sp. Dielmo TaxID=1033738 RepID=UPI0002DFF0E2|nr:hypothetical protein [Kurthia sp. Dielmo]
MSLVIDEIIQDYNGYITTLNNEVPKLIRSIRSASDVSKINAEVVDLFEGMAWIINVNDSLKELNFNNSIDVKKINETLKEIAKAIEFNDYNLCADILEYELLEEIYKLQIYEMTANEDDLNE